jgi:5-methyltetrahydropteroyltriglutamate--homocysteine methyltransferase
VNGVDPSADPERLATADPTLSPRPDHVLDATGLSCATLTPEIRSEVMALEPGQILEILTDDPSAPEALASWTRLTGNELVGGEPAGDIRSRFFIRRGAALTPDAKR